MLTTGVFQAIDTRFNSVFHESMLVHYYHLAQRDSPTFDHDARLAVQAEYANNFFLHFAYDLDFLRFVSSS